MNQLENRQAGYRSNTWMGQTRTDGPDEFDPSKFDCISHIDYTVYPYKHQILLIWQEFQHNDPKEHGHILITLDTDCIPLQTPDSAYLTRIST